VKRAWAGTISVFGLMTATAVTAYAISDRTAALRAVEDRTLSIARVVSAHGDAAIGAAETIVAQVENGVAAWDLQDPVVGREMFDTLRRLMVGSPHVSSAWILDGGGVSRLDTWTFPSEPFESSHRPYFKRHLEGAPDPVIAGDDTPGVVTGQRRFTFSQAERNPDGTLRSIIVVGIYSHQFSAMYQEAASWPDARAGLYSLDGDVLARLDMQERASPQFTDELQRNVASRPSGSALIMDDGVQKLASWHRSSRYPNLYATSSQTVSAALAEWSNRTIVVAGVASLAFLGLSLFAWTRVRVAEARNAAKLNELAIREVHHRVKNALQLLVSMISLRSRKLNDPEARHQLEYMAAQFRAIAEVQDLLQNSSGLDKVEPCALLGQLCQQLQKSYAGEIRFSGNDGGSLDHETAASMAVITNELVTNAMKHSHDLVEVTCEVDSTCVSVTVVDDGPGLPADFDIRSSEGFGLRTAYMMAENTNANLTTAAGSAKGATFRLEIPVAHSSPEQAELSDREMIKVG
jgi:two-component sensor histidine kinase